MNNLIYYISVCNSGHPKQKNGHFCKHKGGSSLLEAFKTKIAEAGLTEKVYLRESGCMNQCIDGISVRVFPGNVLYGKVSHSDIEEIIQSHLIGNIPIQRLRLTIQNRFWE